jgi:small subunit ribosomal protein S1
MTHPDRPKDLTPEPADSPAGEDFAALLAESGGLSSLRLGVGERVHARVVHIGKEDVFCSLSPTQEAVIPKLELVDGEGKLAVKVGDDFDAFVVSLENGIQLSKKLGREGVDVELLKQAAHSQLPVEGLVTGVNKGGLEVAVAGVRAFCPIGQADIGYVESPDVFVGKTLQFVIKEVRDNGRSVVLSRRALLEAERAERSKKVLGTLETGQRLTGKVTRLAEFGAFVDIGGVEGLLPVSEISHARIASPAAVLKEGEELTVQVMRIEPDPKRPDRTRISLSLKAVLPDPFDQHRQDLAEGAMLPGRVMRLEKFGAFVELFPGLEGLVHVSELSNKRIRHPADVLQVGQEVTVRVLGVKTDEKRISLSLKDAPSERAAAGAPLSTGTLVDGTVERHERYGVFVKLASGESALLPAAESGTPPGTDLVKVFPVGSTHALVIVAVDERGRLKVSRRAREAAEDRAVLDEFNKSQGGPKGFGTLGDLLRARSKK